MIHCTTILSVTGTVSKVLKYQDFKQLYVQKYSDVVESTKSESEASGFESESTGLESEYSTRTFSSSPCRVRVYLKIFSFHSTTEHELRNNKKTC